LSETVLLQNCEFKREGSFVYTIVVFEFESGGNKAITICAEEILDKSTLKERKKKISPVQRFIKASLSFMRKGSRGSSGDFENLVKISRPLFKFNLNISGNGMPAV
jgi:hypothetical protein